MSGRPPAVNRAAGVLAVASGDALTGPREHAQALEKFNIEKDIAAYIKKEFDKKHNPTWHCIVGRNFGARPGANRPIAACSVPAGGAVRPACRPAACGARRAWVAATCVRLRGVISRCMRPRRVVRDARDETLSLSVRAPAAAPSPPRKVLRPGRGDGVRLEDPPGRAVGASATGARGGLQRRVPPRRPQSCVLQRMCPQATAVLPSAPLARPDCSLF
jgi:hypothetical protein